MPQYHRLYTDLDLAVVWLRGRISGEDVSKTLGLVYRDPGWKPGYATLWDAREIRALDVNSRDVDAVAMEADRLWSTRGQGKVAIVVNRDLDQHIFALFLLKRKHRERPIEIFWSMRDALHWLGIQNAPAEVARPLGHSREHEH